ncbi:RNA-directed RNA polymerase [Niveomyces insectorum RCEF 264]|uniref:RNA-directed RNA polymerase n=1 Tax=Niveomyces insectorum RCEF 264 TaxID=1081102 RepID=A0A167UI50_9HYPO|nr:RNA-directed RNA polymerase [Niveomyces insectorum RCEF 264]
MAALYGQRAQRMPPNAAFEGAYRPHADGNDPSMLSPPGAENKPPRPVPWQDRDYVNMTVVLNEVPKDVTTLDVYKSMVPLAVLSIEILENNKGERTGTVRVRLVPPKFDYWYDHAWRLQIHGPSPRSVVVSAHVDACSFHNPDETRIKTPLHRWVLSHVDFDLAILGQGFMHQKRTMMVMDEVRNSGSSSSSNGGDGDDPDMAKISLKVNFKRREISIQVNRYLTDNIVPLSESKISAGASPSPPSARMPFEYRIDIRFAWVKNIWEQRFPGGRVCVVIALDSPPEYWRKSRDVAKSLSKDRLGWSGMEQWVRMAFLTMNQQAVRDAAVSLHGSYPEGQAVNLGRWTTFRLGFNQPANVADWRDIAARLRDYDICVKPCPEFRFLPRDNRNMWDCLEDDNGSVQTLASTASSNVHHLSRRLSFEVAYQLEVCISRGILHENTLDVVFLESLAALTPDRASRMLEYVAERGKRIYQPHNVFRDPKAASYWRKTPPVASLDKDRAVYVRKAIVTPTTILFSTPALEAGNSVLRQFWEHHDRFLRVQFTDEWKIGRLSGGPDTRRTDECFSRAFRALKNGIRVGGRHFEFLAFGNSQLRENSTYFFAPTELVSCQDIRDWMGDFSSIKTVAKYAARLGQSLSTTRPVPTFGVPTTVQRIPDVERGRFCFTDGVGKISKWWARTIATHLRNDDVPSAVQFRMGGSKGILVIWPDVPSGQVVQIRPSQEKFPTLDRASTLEIVRCSETATATLNQQTIILLTSLGVPSPVFTDLLREELAGLEAVMQDPRKAVAQLMMRVDQNQVTPIMADMVKAGFMKSDEPFVWALLQLWRSWTLKALKEKARISVEKSAFVLGCVDETDTLRGHSDKENAKSKDDGTNNSGDTSQLAQIFLQVPDVRSSADGVAMLARGGVNRFTTKTVNYKVITGLCLVGRNPSLHPGDLRVVEAVDVPALRHLRDVVVFPRTGDRDIPSMCSGGDLDGDDYFVFWDQRLLPPRHAWNYEAMDYDATREPEVDQVTPRQLISFFVRHMKHDTLPRIAVSHRAYADQLQGGAMHPRCLELAQLHSQAVDYAKTGVPALMPPRLQPKEWPHWMGRTTKRTYKSHTALGRIYDEVQVENFEPAYDKPFDARILNHYPSLDVDLLRRARRIKTQYDLALRRAMAQKEIESEFELWSGFSINRPRVGTDYKVAEDIGRLYKVISRRFRRICLREVDNSHDIAKLGPFVAAMYTVTHEEARIALHEFALMRDDKASKRPTAPNNERNHGRFDQRIAPLISFPWLFAHELAALAKASGVIRSDADSEVAQQNGDNQTKTTKAKEKETEKKTATPETKKEYQNFLLSPAELEKMEYCVQNGVHTHHGIPLDISAYDGSREEDGEEVPDEADFEPMWTLPPGKSEGDIVLQLTAADQNGGQEEDGYDDADYDLLNLQFGPGKAANKKTNAGLSGGRTSKADGGMHLPWADMEDDVLSTTSEESLGDDDDKIVVKRDGDEDEEDVDASKTVPAPPAQNKTEDSDLLKVLSKPSLKEEKENGDDDHTDDVFDAVDKLFSNRDERDARKVGWSSNQIQHKEPIQKAIVFKGSIDKAEPTKPPSNFTTETNDMAFRTDAFTMSSADCVAGGSQSGRNVLAVHHGRAGADVVGGLSLDGSSENDGSLLEITDHRRSGIAGHAPEAKGDQSNVDLLKSLI